MCQQLRLGRGGDIIKQDFGDAAVQNLASALEQILIGCALNERVLETIVCGGREPLHQQDVSVRELFQRGLQRRITYTGDLTKKFVGEVAPNDRPNLCNLAR
jgi:hypothetical protein